MAVIEQLCSVPVDRRPGSRGNDMAVRFVAHRLADAGLDVWVPEFPCLDWVGQGATITLGDMSLPITPSPYGLGVDAEGPVRIVERPADLDREDLAGSVLIATGDLVSEPLTPKAFPFYGSDEHGSIIEALESAVPVAIVAVTGKYPALCGALDPFPWIEDGDFAIPAAAMRPSDASPLLASEGMTAHVSIEAIRRPSTARNVVARIGPEQPRVTVCAHIDTKPGTPGAIDNAAGVAVLVLLGERLAERSSLPIGVELLAVNGEDHFAAPGEVAWLADNEDQLADIELFINLDGVGYRGGGTAYSLYNVAGGRAGRLHDQLANAPHMVEGPSWYQSDHAIFAMRGLPAMAFTTEHIDDMLDRVFHSEADTPDQVDPGLISSLVDELETVIVDWE